MSSRNHSNEHQRHNTETDLVRYGGLFMMTLPLTLIEQMIRINSVTDRSNEEIVRFLTPLIEEAGLKWQTQSVRENGQTFFNLIAFPQTPHDPNLLVLNTHLDTVSPGAFSDWTRTGGDPFQATRVRDRIYGLGAADVKIDFLCKLWAAKQATARTRPFAIVGTFGEERGCVGVNHLIKSGELKPRYAMVGEPSNLELVYAHKGHLVCTLALKLDCNDKKLVDRPIKKRWKGISAHSSTPDLGENALRKGLNDIFKRGYGIVSLVAGTNSNKIPDFCEAEVIPQQTAATRKLFELIRALDEVSRELKKRRDTRFSPPVSTVSLNQAWTDEGELFITFDFRSLPEIDLTRWREKFVKLAEQLQCRVVALEHDAPLKGTRQGRFLEAASKALKACKVPVLKKTKASSTEAAIYNQAGAEAIVFGPGISIGNVHRPNEYNSLKQIDTAIEFYTHLLQLPEGDL